MPPPSYPSRFGPPPALSPFDGVLLVDKPSGMTSHDVVEAVRRHFHLRKTGHCGTLDPLATGLLVLVLGKATRLSSRFMADDKEYEGTLRLGVETDTQDADGRVTRERPATGVTAEAIDRAMAAFRGTIQQVPPMVSALKFKGKRLYKLARKGVEIERAPRQVTISELTLLDYTPPHARFRMCCTKGTYVRTLCADIGAALGCGGHLAQLVRLRSGPFRLQDACALGELLKLPLSGLAARVLSLPRVAGLLPSPFPLERDEDPA